MWDILLHHRHIVDIVGRFNTMSCNRVFIHADECSSFGGAYKQNNKFKSIIVTDTRKLEVKGVDSMICENCCSYLMTTNSPDPVRVEQSDSLARTPHTTQAHMAEWKPKQRLAHMAQMTSKKPKSAWHKWHTEPLLLRRGSYVCQQRYVL